MEWSVVKVKNNKLLAIVSLIIIVVILSACGDKNNADDKITQNENSSLNEKDTSSNDNNFFELSDSEENIKEADAIAREVLEAFMTVDYHTLYDMGASSLKEQMEGDVEDSSFVLSEFDKNNSPLIPHGVSLHDDYYGFERYDTLQDEARGIYWYGIEVISPSIYNTSVRSEKLFDENFAIISDLEVLESTTTMPYYFGIRKEGTDWVVSEVTIFLESQQLISEKEADLAKENKTVIHELVPKSKLAEVYGDMSDVGF